MQGFLYLDTNANTIVTSCDLLMEVCVCGFCQGQLFLVVSPNISVFAGEKSQDAGIQRTKLEVRNFEFDFSMEQLLVLVYDYKLPIQKLAYYCICRRGQI